MRRISVRYHAPDPDCWRKPTGDTQRLVAVAPGEMTCTRCGETYASGGTPFAGESLACTRCGSNAGVATISYLQDWEYRTV